MQTKVQMHKKKKQGNTPGALPLIIRPNIIEQLIEQLTKPKVLSKNASESWQATPSEQRLAMWLRQGNPRICAASNHQPMSNSATQE
jgi:hypothetical protein